MPRTKKRSSMRDRARQRAKQRQSEGGGGGNYLKLPDGMVWFQIDKACDSKLKCDIDILPYEVSVEGIPDEQTVGELWYRRVFYTHRDIGPENKTVLCLSTIGEPCPVCEEQSRMDNDPDVSDKEATALYKKERELFNVDQGADNPVALWDISTKLFGQDLDKEIREGEEEYGGFADLEGGCTLETKWKEKAIGKNKFLECSNIEFNERGDIDEDVLGDVADLDTLFIPMSYEKLSALFHGGEVAPAADDDDLPMDEDENPPRGRSRRGGRSRRQEDPSKDTENNDDDEKEKMIECVACEGSGKNSRGRTCRACDGSGEMVDQDSEPTDDPPTEDDDPPPRSRSRRGGRSRRSR